MVKTPILEHSLQCKLCKEELVPVEEKIYTTGGDMNLESEIHSIIYKCPNDRSFDGTHTTREIRSD